MYRGSLLLTRGHTAEELVMALEHVYSDIQLAKEFNRSLTAIHNMRAKALCAIKKIYKLSSRKEVELGQIHGHYKVVGVELNEFDNPVYKVKCLNCGHIYRKTAKWLRWYDRHNTKFCQHCIPPRKIKTVEYKGEIYNGINDLAKKTGLDKKMLDQHYRRHNGDMSTFGIKKFKV